MNFLDALLTAKKLNQTKRNLVIPDIKCFSPKEGDLMRGRNPVEYAKALCLAGAPVLSVVTEEKEFRGSMQILREITRAVEVPVLRKDFIHTREDLLATKEAGASAILLMCSCLTREELTKLYYEALEIGLDPFVETHKPEDFALIRDLDAKLVGINNRNILELERDNGNVQLTENLSQYVPEDVFLITESSIQNATQVRRAVRAGADAALVGTTLLLADNPANCYYELCKPYDIKICGVMRQEDEAICLKNGISRIGFVVEYPKAVPWNLTKEQAVKLCADIPQGMQEIQTVMVTGGSVEQVCTLADYVNPDIVQLHYKEKLEEIREISRRLREKGIGTICALPMREEERRERFGTTDFSSMLASLQDTEVEAYLIDARGPENAAEQNLSFSLSWMEDVKNAVKTGKEVILAGGLTGNNLKQIIKETGVSSIDILSGSEETPGVKSEAKIKAIVSAMREAIYS